MWQRSRNTLWNPWNELTTIDRALAPFFEGITGAKPDFPPVNVWKSQDKISFTFELPGMNPEDIEITAKADTLTVKGKRAPEALPEGAQLVRQERGAGSFSRTFAIPFKVDQETITASYINGILTVSLAKAAEAQPRKIAIQA